MEKLREILVRWNQIGVPLPMVMNPDTGKASVTLTLVCVSFLVNIIAFSGKLAGLFGGLDTSGASYLFLMSLGAYLGRRMTGDSKTNKVDLSTETKEK